MAQSTGVDTNPPLRTIARNLRAIEPGYAKRLGKINKTAGDVIVSAAKGRSGELPSRYAKAREGFASSATAAYVKIAVRNTKRVPYALGAVLGTKHDLPRKRTRAGQLVEVSGWNQFPSWVGNQWTPGSSGGPRALNPAIAAKLDEVLGLHARALEELFEQIDRGL